jgi:hypothetical protein
MATKLGVYMATNKQWANLNDNRIMEMALYHETDGLTKMLHDGQKVFERFVEFKKYIVRGSFTLEQLEETVYLNKGIMPTENIEENEVPTPQATTDFLDALASMANTIRKRQDNGKGKEDI